MNSPAHDTALYLELVGATGAIGGSDGWPVFVGREPITPVDVVTCYDTGGTAGPLVDLRHPTVQVRVRSSTYNVGWQKMNEILEILVEPFFYAVTGATILGWRTISDAAFIGRDDKDRAVFTANFEMLRDSAAV